MFAMINTNANSFQVKQNTAAQSAAQQTARTQNTGVNRAAVEKRVESQVESSAKSEVKREQAGKSAAEEMRRENTAITQKPDDGIQLEISKKGLEREQNAAREKDQPKPTEDKDNKAVQNDEKSATEQRVEEQQKVREKIREQVKAELDDEEKKARQTERRDEDREERQQVQQKQQEDDARKENITNFAGYTNAQLQQMAQRGEISQNDYRTEIKNREEKVEETKQSLTDTDKQLAKDIYREDRVDRDMKAIDTAFDEDSNNNINAKTRAQVLQDLENPQNTQAQQENTQREQQARAFAQWQNDFGFLIR